MTSHESYYNTANPTPPPLPPPKSHDPSRTATPSVPPVPPHPNAPHSHPQVQGYLPNQSSPSPRPPPQITEQSYQPQTQPQQQNRYQQPYQQEPIHTQQYQPSPQIPSTAAPPLDSGWLPESVKDHTTADLQALLNNSDLLDAFAKQHPAFEASLEPLKAAVATNLSLAQHVAQLEAQVNQLRDQTGQLLLNHTSLQTQWRRKQSEMDDALSSWGPRAMYSRLVSSINEQESLLRAVHESFVEGGGESNEFYGNANGKASEKEVTEWIKRIREGTTVLEKRREMRQRWDEGRVGGWR